MNENENEKLYNELVITATVLISKAEASNVWIGKNCIIPITVDSAKELAKLLNRAAEALSQRWAK
jgi:hypothetical protein